MFNEDRKGQSSLRKGRYSEANRVYHITSSTFGRKPIFAGFDYAQAAIKGFLHSKVIKDSTVLCWVLMPDHVHWLIQLGETAELSKLVGAMKSTAARNIKALGYKQEIWNKGFYDRGIRKEDDLLDVARYIIANPLRAGLVKRFGDYPYWDAVYF